MTCHQLSLLLNTQKSNCQHQKGEQIILAGLRYCILFRNKNSQCLAFFGRFPKFRARVG